MVSFPWIRLARAVIALSFVASAVEAQENRITLLEALQRSTMQNPEVRTAVAELETARGQRTAAGVWRYNPQVFGFAGPARNPDTSLTSYQVGLTQAFELGGKRGSRVAAADLRIEAAAARVARQQALARARTRRAFALAVLARDRATTAATAESVATMLRDAAVERLQLGAGTQLELNVARAAAVRERWLRLVAERQAISARFDLAATIGLPPDQFVDPEGPLPPLPDEVPAEADLVALAEARRSDVAAARAEAEATEADIRAARAQAVPDPQVGIAAGQNEDFSVTLFSVSLPLPVFNRGQGDRAVAYAEAARAAIAADTTRTRAEREIRDSYRGYVKARDAIRTFDMQAVGALQENIALATESFQAGKISLLILNSVRRELLDAQFAYLDALADLYERFLGLEAATQVSPESAP